MEEELMPDFDTRKPQGSNEPNRPRMTSITNRLSGLLSASKHRILSIASALRRSLIANRYRSLFVGGVLLFVVVAAPVGLLIYSFGGFDHLQQMDIQQETRTIPGMQMSHMENIRIDENQKGKLVFQLSGPYQTPLNYAISNMNANGSSLEQLTDTVDKRRLGYTSEDPARSPDLKRIDFTRPASQYPASVDASASASASASAGSAGPSPILVPYVFVMNADGSEETRLVDMAAAKPDWSPDGQKIAFTRQGCPGAAPESETMNATTGIFTMDSDGTDPALVRFFVNEIASSPEWGATAQQVGVTKQANEGQPAEEAIADWQALDARLPDLALQAYIEQINELLRGVNLHDRVVSFEET